MDLNGRPIKKAGQTGTAKCGKVSLSALREKLASVCVHPILTMRYVVLLGLAEHSTRNDPMYFCTREFDCSALHQFSPSLT